MAVTLKLVDAQIRRMSGLAFRILKFPGELELRFEQDTRAERCRRLWLEGLLAIGALAVVLLVGLEKEPDASTRVFIRKAFLIIPLALCVNFAMLLRLGERLRESSIALITIVVGWSILNFESNRPGSEAVLGQLGISAVLVFGNCVMRLRVPYAMAVSVALAMGEVSFSLVDRVHSSTEKALGLCLSMTTLLFTVIANYSHNREERLSFLHCIRGDLLIEELCEANASLSVAADEDALTGLANRRAFDRRLSGAWEAAREGGSLLAIILIDVDNFKRLNDMFVHLYGDKVLCRVARLMCEALRRDADFAARFGGEEFVILLPGTSAQAAEGVAEGIRRLIEVAGLPELEGDAVLPEDSRATVSCGVVAGSPLQFESTQHFIDSADRALYLAKESGRNLVRVAHSEAPSLWLPTSAVH